MSDKPLSDMTLSELENAMQNYVKEMESAGWNWATSKGVYEDLDDKRKSSLAYVMNQGEGSNAERERVALASDTYTAFLQGLGAARMEFLKSQVGYDVAKLKIEAIRTVISTRRQEIKTFQG